jgi:hypothetical protein
MFKKFLLPVAFLLSFSSEASALTQSEKIKSCLDGTLSLEEEPLLIIEMQNWKVTFSPFVQNNTAACFTKLTGEPAEFINGEGLIIDQQGLTTLQEAREKAQANRIAQELEREVQALEREAAEEALKVLKSRIYENISRLMKHEKCVEAKRLDVVKSIEAIEKENSLIISRDTHAACTALYAKDKTNVMMNQTCIEAFKSFGHPEIINSAIEKQKHYSLKEAELLILELALIRERKHYQDELSKVMQAGKVIPIEKFQPKAEEANKLRSCVEFGYAGIYIE